MTSDRLAMIGGITAAIIFLVGVSIFMLLREVRVRENRARVMQSVLGQSGNAPLTGIIKYLHSLGERLRRVYSPQSLDHLRGVVQAAGYNPHRVLPVLLGIKVVMMILFPVMAAIAASFIDLVQIRLVVVGVGVIVGVMGLDLALGFARRRFVADVSRGTPDTLDLLVVCSEAGMGLESALDRVSKEMQHSNRAMASVLASLLDDLRVLPDRREAFVTLGTRTGVEGLQRFGTMLGQSLQYGTPLSQALRAVATELRRDRINKLEEKAVKLPAMLIFPLIFFIMPSLYIVLLGPAFMRLYDSLSLFTGGLP